MRTLRDHIRHPALLGLTNAIAVIEFEWSIRIRRFTTIHAWAGGKNQRPQLTVEGVECIGPRTGLIPLRTDIIGIPFARVFSTLFYRLRHG